MAPHTAKQTAPAANDAEQVQRALAGDAGVFSAIMQTHNRRLYRIARSILRNNADAEDAVQHRGAERRSDLAVFDTVSLETAPIALAELSHRVPFGFHGNWRPDVGN